MASEREEDLAWEGQGVWLAVQAVLSLEEQAVEAVLSLEEQAVQAVLSLEEQAVLSLEEQEAVEAGQVCYPHHP